eukprot:SAG31_NODE_6199_length_2127_cov_1.691815_2_plen_306_part_00
MPAVPDQRPEQGDSDGGNLLPPPLLAAGFPPNIIALCQPCQSGKTQAKVAPVGSCFAGGAQLQCGCSARRDADTSTDKNRGCSGLARAAATKLVAQLQRGQRPQWAHELPAQVPGEVPASLRTYAAVAQAHGLELADVLLFGNEIVEPPVAVKSYVSGDRDRALRPREPAVSAFLASLFHIIQHESPVSVELAGWDLYHGHMFLHRGSSANHSSSMSLCEDVRYDNGTDTPAACDLGILFHAKEFPVEHRLSSFGPIYPIGAAEMGGARDPRHGTLCSTKQQFYPLRNYLWLLSTNKVIIYLLDH